MQKVDFRYSDSDFVSYLMSIGYTFTHIEVTKDKKDRYKAFVHFTENKSDLLKHFDDYKNGNVEINALGFSKNRKLINQLIKSEIHKSKNNCK